MLLLGEEASQQGVPDAHGLAQRDPVSVRADQARLELGGRHVPHPGSLAVVRRRVSRAERRTPRRRVPGLGGGRHGERLAQTSGGRHRA